MIVPLSNADTHAAPPEAAALRAKLLHYRRASAAAMLCGNILYALQMSYAAALLRAALTPKEHMQ
jgi:hypothetical protein